MIRRIRALVHQQGFTLAGARCGFKKKMQRASKRLMMIPGDGASRSNPRA